MPLSAYVFACPCAQSWSHIEQGDHEQKPAVQADIKKEDASADTAQAACAAGPKKPAEDAADFMVRLQSSVLYCVCRFCVLARVTIFTSVQHSRPCAT
jgi:hypothetical protein